MRIFLDTNVVMDYLTSRGDEQATEKILSPLIQGRISALSQQALSIQSSI